MNINDKINYEVIFNIMYLLLSLIIITLISEILVFSYTETRILYICAMIFWIATLIQEILNLRKNNNQMKGGKT